MRVGRKYCAPRKPPCTRRRPKVAVDPSCTNPTRCSRPTPRKRPRCSMRKLFCFLLCLLASGAWAQEPDAQARLKLAPDLLAAIAAPSLPLLPWLKAVDGEPRVKVLVTSSSPDDSLADLRSFVLSLGGSVFHNYASLRMVAVMVPASRVLEIARRADVVSVSPNRAVVRTASQ